MKKSFLFLSILFLFCFIFTNYGFAQIPRILNYQGYLCDSTGVPVANGSYTMVFKLYEHSSQGTALWSEQQVVQVSKGFFTVNLGSSTQLNVPFNKQYWLGITIGSGPELSPRIQLTSSAYTLNALSVVDSSITSSKIQDSAITSSKIANKAILSTKLADSSITTTKLANNAVTSEKIADGAITQAKLAPGISVPVSGSAGGDLTGAYPNPTIKNNVITNAKIQDSAVTTPKLANNAVTSEKIADGAITQSKLASNISVPISGSAGGHLTGTYPNPTIKASVITADHISWPLSFYSSYNTFILGDFGNYLFYAAKNNGFVKVCSTALASLVVSQGNYYRAANINGDVDVNGHLRVYGMFTVSGTKNFMIDHPLDPENKYLIHYCTESNEPLNFYSGTVITDGSGNAIVTLPEYFEALNRDFQYQLTVVGQFAQAIVSEEIHNNRFAIKTDKPNVKVCWQVTGVRNDRYMQENPPKTEIVKGPKEKGKYLNPNLYGAPASSGIFEIGE